MSPGLPLPDLHFFSVLNKEYENLSPYGEYLLSVLNTILL